MIKNRDKTLSEEKSLLVFQRVLDEEKTQEEIMRIRKELNIPIDGFIFNKKSNIKLPNDNENNYKANGLRWVPINKYKRETKKILSMFPIMNDYFSIILRNYIYYNKLLIKELSKYKDPSNDACKIMDAKWESGYFCIPPQDEEPVISYESWNKKVEDIIYDYPLCIRFKVDVGERMLIGFIRKNWNLIEQLQSNYTGKNSYSLKKSKRKINTLIKERDDFIYKNQNMLRKKLWEILNKKYKNALGLEYASLAKIISRENKRRLKK